MVCEPHAQLYYGWEPDTTKLKKYIERNFDLDDDDEFYDDDDYYMLSEHFKISFEKLEFVSNYFNTSGNNEPCIRNYIIIKQYFVMIDECYNLYNKHFNIVTLDPMEELKNIPKCDLQKLKKIGCSGEPKVFMITSTGIQ